MCTHGMVADVVVNASWGAVAAAAAAAAKMWESPHFPWESGGAGGASAPRHRLSVLPAPLSQLYRCR